MLRNKKKERNMDKKEKKEDKKVVKKIVKKVKKVPIKSEVLTQKINIKIGDTTKKQTRKRKPRINKKKVEKEQVEQVSPQIIPQIIKQPPRVQYMPPIIQQIKAEPISLTDISKPVKKEEGSSMSIADLIKSIEESQLQQTEEVKEEELPSISEFVESYDVEESYQKPSYSFQEPSYSNRPISVDFLEDRKPSSLLSSLDYNSPKLLGQRYEIPEMSLIPYYEEKQEEPIQEPIQEKVQEPIQEPIQEPVQEPIQEPVQEPIQEQVQEPIQEPIQEPVQEPVQEEEKSLRGKNYNTMVKEILRSSNLTFTIMSQIEKYEGKSSKQLTKKAKDYIKDIYDKIIIQERKKTEISDKLNYLNSNLDLTSKESKRIRKISEKEKLSKSDKDYIESLYDTYRIEVDF